MLYFLFIASYAETITGDCGKNVKYSFDKDNGNFTISGSGPMTDYDYPNNLSPWCQYEYKINIKSVVISEGVTTVGAYAFFGCVGLMSITIPANVSFIGEGALFKSSNLKSVTIPESVEYIGEWAFYFSGLTSINIPENVTYIGYGAFGSCTSMTSINVSPNNKAFKSKEGVLFNYTENVLLCYPGGKGMNRYFIPFGVEIIIECAFSRCNYLSSITFPTSIIKIYRNAIEYCERLSSMLNRYFVRLCIL